MKNEALQTIYMKGEPLQASDAPADDWATSFLPSDITCINLKTGKQVQEPSLVAVQRTYPTARVLAAGSAALDYRDTPGVAVYSPLRYGQIADFTAALQMFRIFCQSIRSRTDFTLFKPVICIRAQERITEVEERALVDTAIQVGARRVFLYLEPLVTLLGIARGDKKLKNAYVIHIEPRDTDAP